MIKLFEAAKKISKPKTKTESQDKIIENINQKSKFKNLTYGKFKEQLQYTLFLPKILIKSV